MAYLGARPPDIVWVLALNRFRDLRLRHKWQHGPGSTFDTEPPPSRESVSLHYADAERELVRLGYSANLGSTRPFKPA